MLKSWTLACACWVTMGFACNTWATVENPFILPMGLKESLLGNSGLTLKGSPGGLLFNPAGLAYISGNRLSVTGTTYAVLDAHVQISNISDEVGFSSFAAVPNMLVGATQLEDWTLAYGVFVPISIELNVGLKTEVAALGGTLHTNQFSRTEEQYFGVGASRKIADDWAVGAALFAQRYARFEVSNSRIERTTGIINLQESVQRDEEVASLLFILGTQKDLNEKWRIGSRIISPSFQVYDYSVFKKDAMVDLTNDSSGATFTKERPNSSTEYQSQMEVGIGARHTGDTGNALNLDLAVSMPESYREMIGTSVELERRYETTVRYSIGYEYRISDSTHLMGGFLANPSTVKDSSESSSNYHGLTFGLYQQHENLDMALGGYYLRSRSDARVLGPSPNDNSSFRIYGVMISSSIRY